MMLYVSNSYFISIIIVLTFYIDREEEEEDYQEKIEQQLAKQEEEDVDKIKEESRKRRQAILEKYKQQQLQKQQPESLPSISEKGISFLLLHNDSLFVDTFVFPQKLASLDTLTICRQYIECRRKAIQCD